MTRINCVPVQELCNKHLFAEWRELPRINKYIEKSLGKVCPLVLESKISPKYILGTGHVKFFYNKLTYLENRYNELTKELLLRNYNINVRELVLSGPDFWKKDWTPTKEEMDINRERIKDRLPLNAKYRSKYD